MHFCRCAGAGVDAFQVEGQGARCSHEPAERSIAFEADTVTLVSDRPAGVRHYGIH